MGHLHGNFIVRNINELHLLGHLLYEAGVTAHVGIVERGVHLIQHTKWRRIEAENRKHQGNRRECLFTPRQQLDGAVTLARWARDRKSTRLNASHVATSYCVY